MDEDICSVCMGDLKPGDEKAVKTAPIAVADSSSAATAVSSATTSNAIAQLIPCGHIFHDECVRTWTERANSCPLCRQNFNVVKISAFLGGPSITQYTVEDRKQRTESEFDWSLAADNILPEPCRVCNLENNLELLLTCASCDAPYHTYCINDETTPYCEWYCEECKLQLEQFRFSDSSEFPARFRRASQPFVRRSAANGRDSRRRGISSLEQAQNLANVYNSPQHRIPAVVDNSTVAVTPPSARRDAVEMSRRQETETEDTASNASSAEEQNAWDAFEIARKVEMEGSTPEKKRAKSVPKTEEATPQPERKLKRPRTRRTEQIEKPVAETSDRNAKRKRVDEDEPGFLSSELKRVEAYNETAGPARKRMATSALGLTSAVLPKYPKLNHSPGPSSPTSASPAESERYTPKFGSEVLTPLPKANYFDPVGQSLKLALSYSNPQSPAASPPAQYTDPLAQPGSPLAGSPQAYSADRPPTRHAHSPPAPTCKTLVLEMVRNELRPFLRAKEITGDDFESINRSVTQQLYTEVDDISALQGESKATWQNLAKQRVQKAVHEIKQHTVEAAAA